MHPSLNGAGSICQAQAKTNFIHFFSPLSVAFQALGIFQIEKAGVTQQYLHPDGQMHTLLICINSLSLKTK